MAANGRSHKSLRMELWFVVALIAVLVFVLLRSVTGFVEEAHTFKAEQVRDSFKGALRVLHTSWLAAGRPQLVMDFAGYGSGALNLNENGWPVAVSGLSNSSEVTETGCREVFTELLQDVYADADQLQNQQLKGQQPSSVINSAQPAINVLAVGTVCVYQIGNGQQDSFSILYNADSGEVRMTQH